MRLDKVFYASNSRINMKALANTTREISRREQTGSILGGMV